VQPIVIWFGRVGDMIMLTALLEILHRRYGRACRVIGAGAWSQEIYEGQPDVAETLWLRRYTPYALDLRWWRTVWKLRRGRRDPVYVCETDPRKLAGIRRLLRYGRVERTRCVFLTDEPTALAQVHWVDRLVALGRLTPPALHDSGYPSVDCQPHSGSPPPQASLMSAAKGVECRCAPRLLVSSTARAAGDEWARKHDVRDRPLVLLQPGNRRTMRGRSLHIKESDDRFWPVDRWASLIHWIHERLPEARIVLCGAPREEVLLGWIESAAALPQIVLRGMPFPGLFALCARAHSMISIDTGTAHAAAALGTPLVVLFGSTPPAQVTPRSPCGSPVIGVGGVPLLPRVDQLPVEAVFEAWTRLLLSSTSAATAP
jgi:heptosyltransferase-2/heptosyltransferase-3